MGVEHVKRPEDMSRDELLQTVIEMKKALWRMNNQPSLQKCPFCFGTTQVPLIKIQVKEAIVHEWHKDVTEEQWLEYFFAQFPQQQPAQA